MSFTFDSSKHTALKGALPIEATKVVRIVDEFVLEVQASSSHFQQYKGPLIRSKLTRKQLDHIRETCRISNFLECW